MCPQRVSSSNLISVAFVAVLLALVGCGSDSDFDPNESERTRAIREKVRADMEKERLQQYGRRLESLNESLANSPTAVMLAAASADAESANDGDSGTTGLERGEALYTQNCASCHGARGAGDGPLAASLVPQPAKHSDGNYMNALSDDHLFKVIKEGGAAIGKSPMMAPWGPSMSDAKIRDVVEFLRSLADPPYSTTKS